MHKIFRYSFTHLHIATQKYFQHFRPSYFSTDIPVRTLEYTATVLYALGKILTTRKSLPLRSGDHKFYGMAPDHCPIPACLELVILMRTNTRGASLVLRFKSIEKKKKCCYRL